MDYVLIPNEFFVGDKVKLLYPLPENYPFHTLSLNIERINQNDTLTIDEISIAKFNNQTCLLINFTPWQVGKLSFPSLKELGITFNIPHVNVSSFLDIDDLHFSILQPPRSPMLLPGTLYMIYAYIGGGIFFILSIISLLMLARKKGRAIGRFIFDSYNIFIFYLALIKLKLKLKCSDIKSTHIFNSNAWAKHYEKCLREFLFSIYNKEKLATWVALTYTEMQDCVSAYNNIEVQDKIKNIFKNLSFIRFGKYSAKGMIKEKELLKDSFTLISLCKKKK